MLSAVELIDPADRHRALAATDLPTASGEMFTSRYPLFQKVRRRSTVALTGEAADELSGGSKWFYDQAAMNADTFPWPAVRNRIRGDEADPRYSLLDTACSTSCGCSATRRPCTRC
jgi:asparagine synthase (glutamine-hydrolysing)